MVPDDARDAVVDGDGRRRASCGAVGMTASRATRTLEAEGA
jgi:hypothetical protein